MHCRWISLLPPTLSLAVRIWRPQPTTTLCNGLGTEKLLGIWLLPWLQKGPYPNTRVLRLITILMCWFCVLFIYYIITITLSFGGSWDGFLLQREGARVVERPRLHHAEGIVVFVIVWVVWFAEFVMNKIYFPFGVLKDFVNHFNFKEI